MHGGANDYDFGGFAWPDALANESWVNYQKTHSDAFLRSQELLRRGKDSFIDRNFETLKGPQFGEIFNSLLGEKDPDERPTWQHQFLALIDEPCISINDFFSGDSPTQTQNNWFHPELQVFYTISPSRKSYFESMKRGIRGFLDKADPPMGGFTYKYCKPKTVTSFFGKPFEKIYDGMKDAVGEFSETVKNELPEGDNKGKKCIPVLHSNKLFGYESNGAGITYKALFCAIRTLTFPFLHIILLITPVLWEFIAIFKGILVKIFVPLWNSTVGLISVGSAIIPGEVDDSKFSKEYDEKEKEYIPWPTDIIPMYFFSIIPGLNSIAASLSKTGIKTESGYWAQRWGDGKIGKFIVAGAIVSACIIGISGISIVMVLIAFASYCAKVIGLLTSNVED